MEAAPHQTVLEIFEGPLDLLLYLIRKDEVDIYDIPIQRIAEQYLAYLDLMQMLDLDIAGEFLAMAATLMYIKSRMLLPEEEREEMEEEEDPRWELVRQLLEYRRFKEISQDFHRMEIDQEDYFTRSRAGMEPPPPAEEPVEEISIFFLLDAFSRVLSRAAGRIPAEMTADPFTEEDGRRRMLERTKTGCRVRFEALFDPGESRPRMVVIFLVLLHLIQQKLMRVVQEGHFGDILVERLSD
jgi:segregation and condensation protein A